MTFSSVQPLPSQSSAEDEGTFIGAHIGWKDIPGKGRGVFALRDIAKDAIIETAPAIVMAHEDVPEGVPPDGYVLDWEPEEEGEEHALVLGYIMLYNHSSNPNIRLENDHEEVTVSAIALRDIKAGEELCWDYNCEIWFDEE